MTLDPYGKRNSRKAYADTRKTHGVVQTALDSVWHWLNGVAGAAGHLFGINVIAGFKTVWAAIHTIVDAYKDFIKTYFSLYYWIQIHVLKYLIHLILKKDEEQIAALRAQVARLIRLIYVATNTVLVTCLRAVGAEKTARIRDIKRAEAQLQARIKALHQTIEREAVSGYRIQDDQRTALIVRLLEYAVTRNPELRDVVGLLTRGIIDLFSVDDPIARIALGFLIRDVIDRLGIDRIAGNLIRDLLAPILGQPKPKGLHDVVMDLGARLASAEQFEAVFTEDGGAQVEQAGRMWRDITQPVIAGSILGFIAFGVADPNGWARTVNDVIGVPANAAADAVTKLVKRL